MRKLIFISFSIIGGVLACSGADTVDVLSPSANNPDNGVDGSTADGSQPKTDGGNACDPSKCNINVPQGWKLATASKDRTAACPDGWKTTDVVADPVADPAACSCGCNVTQQPDCPGGAVTRNLDPGTNTCSQAATTLQVTGGGLCDPFNNFFIMLQGKAYQTIPPKAKGGACQFDAKADTSKVKTVDGRVCEPPPSCQGDICKMAQICVMQDGDVACPSDFSNKRLIGAAPKVECAACSGPCDVKGDCSGTLSMYTDKTCTQGKIDFTADGNCDPAPNGNNLQYQAASYTGAVKNAGCAQTPPTSAPTVKLDQPMTVCCKP
jgi:hypothetical protein